MSSASSGAVLATDPSSGEVRQLYSGTGARVSDSALSVGGTSVAFGCEDGSTAWVDETGTVIAANPARPAGIVRVVLSSDGQRMAWSDAHGFVGIHARDGRRIEPFAANLTNDAKRAVFGLGFSRDGKRLLTSADEHHARWWDTDRAGDPVLFSTRPLREVVALTESLLVVPMWGHELYGIALDSGSHGWYESMRARVSGLRVDASERLLLAVYGRGLAELRRSADGSLLQRYEHGSSPLVGAEFSPDGRAVVTAAEDGSIRVWPVDVASLAREHVPVPEEFWAAHASEEER